MFLETPHVEVPSRGHLRDILRQLHPVLIVPVQLADLHQAVAQRFPELQPGRKLSWPETGRHQAIGNGKPQNCPRKLEHVGKMWEKMWEKYDPWPHLKRSSQATQRVIGFGLEMRGQDLSFDQNLNKRTNQQHIRFATPKVKGGKKITVSPA